MTFAKKARGMMARFIIEKRITKPNDLKNFNYDKYIFQDSLSTENDWYFTR